MKKIISIIGARPQFIKHAPMQIELQKYFHSLTIHTGQHYDDNMSEVFFKEFGMKEPDYLFEIGSKPQGEQTGIMLTQIEKVCLKEKPDFVLIYGDTNSTLAGALVAVKLHIPIIHVEAGLRSYNREMPEEVNRIVADRFSSFLFCPTNDSIKNLEKEGIIHPYIFRCGDVMCDTLSMVQNKVERKGEPDPYYFATIHRPYNTDDKMRLVYILESLQRLGIRVVFPIHPRTLNKLKSYKFDTGKFTNIEFINPVGYLDSISYQKYSECVITDSGGIQKEAYMLKKKCITIRKETEWVETIKGNWNTLIFDDLDNIAMIAELETENYQFELFGDGNAAKEIVAIINENVNYSH